MIKRLEVEGYRLLDAFEADLGGLTVIIGANGSGKSTLIDWLQFISQAAQHPINDVILWHGGLILILTARERRDELTWRVSFDRSEGPGLWASLPIRPGRELVYEVELRKDALWTAVPAYEALRYREALGHTLPFKFLESRNGRHRIYDVDQKQVIEPSLFPEHGPGEGVGEGLGSFDRESRVRDQAPVAERTLLLLAQQQFLGKYPVPFFARLVLASFAFYPGFKVSPDAPTRRPSPISPNPVLDPGGDNLSAILHNVFSRYAFREAADEVRGFLRSAYPWVEEVTAEPSYAGGGTVSVRVQESGMQRQMELADLSDGMLRFLCLEAALLNPALPTLIAIDEPEAGLHPRLLPIVADIIKTAAERTQVLVTTHSPHLLQCFNLDQIAVMTRDGTRARWYRPSTRESLREMLEAVGGDTLADLHRSGELEAMP
jgi:predicted ATPase